MSIKLTQVPEVERAVTVHVPRADGGHDLEDIHVTYKLLSASQFRADGELQRADPDALTDDDLMRRDITAVRGVKGEDGKDMPFGTDLLEALLDRTDTRTAIVAGWYMVQTNREQEARKN